MERNFPRSVEFVLKAEGGLSDHEKDSGGRTKFGVSDLADGVADRMIDLDRDGVPDVRVDDLTRAQAEAYFRRWYWRPSGCDELPEGLDLCVFDFAVNAGVTRAVVYLQRLVSADVDGDFGPKTARAVLEGVARYGVGPLVLSYNVDREKFYRSVRHRETGELLFPTFGRGWINRVADCQRAALGFIDAAELA